MTSKATVHVSADHATDSTPRSASNGGIQGRSRVIGPSRDAVTGEHLPSKALLRTVVVLALVFVASSAASAQTGMVELSVGRAEVDAERRVRVPLQVRTPGGLGALEIEILFDETTLRFVKVEEARLLDDALLESKLRAAGRLRCVLASSKPIVDDGTLFVAQFEVVGDASRTKIDLQKSLAWDYENVFEMRVSTSAADVELAAPAGGLPWLPLIAGLVGLLLAGWVVRRSRART